MWFGLEIDVVGLPPLLVRFRYSDQVMGTHGSSSNMHGENSIEETSVWRDMWTLNIQIAYVFYRGGFNQYLRFFCDLTLPPNVADLTNISGGGGIIAR